MNYVNTNNISQFKNFNVKPSQKNLVNFLGIRKNKNILFIGSCRLYSIINYFLLLDIFSNYNIYYIYVPNFSNKIVPVENINKIIKNTSIIICETVNSYNFLNTEKQFSYNIFQTYDITKKCKIVYISNLTLFMYYKCFHHMSKVLDENFFQQRNKSLTRLNNKLLNNKEYNIKECIDKYLFNQKFPLFYTFNHPSGFLAMLSFKNVCDNLKIDIANNKMLENYATDLKYFSLYGNNTTLTYWDKRIYNISFCKNFDNNYCKGYLSQNQYKIDRQLEKQILVNYI